MHLKKCWAHCAPPPVTNRVKGHFEVKVIYCFMEDFGLVDDNQYKNPAKIAKCHNCFDKYDSSFKQCGKTPIPLNSSQSGVCTFALRMWLAAWEPH